MKFFASPEKQWDPIQVAQQLRVPDTRIVSVLLDTLHGTVAPEAAYRVSYVEALKDNQVTISGTVFTSKVLCQYLKTVGRVFPFVLTLGPAFDAVCAARKDLLENYLLIEIGNLALDDARRRFEKHLRSAFALKKVACMEPGALADWPIEQQKPLFDLLDGVATDLGVVLTDSCLMLPQKTVSGIYFPTEKSFYSCQLCPRQQCSQRKARYDPDKARMLAGLGNCSENGAP